MKNKEFRMLQLFAAEEGTTLSTDLAPAISVDFVTRIAQNIVELQQLLGITDLVPMAAGTDVKIYKWTVEDLADQVGASIGETQRLRRSRESEGALRSTRAMKS